MTTTPSSGGPGAPSGGGPLEIKGKMTKMRAQVAELDSKTEQLEKERDEKEEYITQSIEKRREMSIQYEETEEKLRKSEERLKALMEQVRDAEVFLEESTNFQRFLSKDSVGEDKITQRMEQLRSHKEAYEENAKKCRKAEKRKVKLTRQNEAANNQLKESLKKIETLKLKLEYGRIDEARKSASCEKQMVAAQVCEKNFRSLDIAFKDVSKRKAQGYERIVALKERILAVEEEVEEAQRNRTEVELRTRDLKLYGSMHTVY